LASSILEAMKPADTVVGRIKLSAPPGVAVPASAMTEAGGHPAVWVFDPQSKTVSLRDVPVLRYDPASVVTTQGVETGEVVVTAGVQTLRPGQKVGRRQQNRLCTLEERAQKAPRHVVLARGCEPK
jgi:multidrug efflux pump subunit AcrA (membrane-fusion protein)